MKKNILFTSLLFAGLIFSINGAQAQPHHGPHGNMGHKPPMHSMRRPPAPPPMIHHHPPMHHHRGHLRRSVIYANYGYGYPCVGWGIGGYYPQHFGSHISFGFRL